MTGLFASLSVRKALDKLASFLPASLASPWVPSSSSATPTTSKDLEDLRRLERTMRRIHATLHDAEEHWNIREESAKLRLKELKDLAYDAEDVVEEYEYEVNWCKVKAPERSTRINRKRKREKVLAVQARKIIERFEEIKDYSDNFTLSENDGERHFAPDISSIRKTSSVVFEKSILGRAQDKNKVVKKLFSREGDSTNSPVSVLAIVGMGGLGKTTLAQLVYNDPRVHQSFDKHAWVCVSEQFDISSITRSIISSLTKDRCDLSELGNLQERLVDEIKEKRVLLVLDDVWNERSDCWDSLCMPMMTTRLCKIVVTTRNEAVARLVQTMPLHRLNCLSFDEGWSLFKQVAFSVHQENDTPANLIEIGKSIVKKCKGLPLAIKTLGSMLRYETDERRWTDFSESKLVDLEKPRDEVLPALELSYRHMPIYLKRCFVSLSLYPKDYPLGEYSVIKLWKLLDLLECDGNDNKDEIGRLYFNELVERSFLQGNYFGKGHYVMHDLLHDLACFLAAEEFFRLEGDTSVEIPQNARYLSIQDTSGVISVASNSLRAIIVLDCANVNIQNPEALFFNSEKLRVLVFDERCLGEALPDFMGSLKLLRNLSCSEYMTSFTDDLRGGRINLRSLPGIGRLINLHSLLGIGRLINLRELRSLNKIREVRISVDSVARIEDANEAQLHSKRHLRSLALHFGGYGQEHKQISAPVSQEQVFESLRPHHSLRKLEIYFYECQKYPCWLGNPSFSNLTEILLLFCNTQHLPTLGELPSLKSLDVCVIRYVRHIGREFCSHVPGVKGFPSLTRLNFSGMEVCSEWSGVDIGEFPCLETLSIADAYELRSLPSVPFLSLLTLNLDDCKTLATIPACPTLLKLSISGCPKLSSVGSLPSLAILNLKHGLPQDETLHRLLNYHASLECVTIICDSTECIRLDPQGLPSLRKLRLSCRNLRYCDGIAGLTCLKELKLWGCPNLPVHSLLPRQLQNLDIRDTGGAFLRCRIWSHDRIRATGRVWRFEDFDHPWIFRRQ